MKGLLAATCIIISSFSAMAIVHSNNAYTTAAKIEEGKYIDVVSVSPNPQKNGTVTVASNASETLRFYIFDTDGLMVHQDELKSKQQKKINNLKKGNYVFDAFLKNEGVQHDTLIVE